MLQTSLFLLQLLQFLLCIIFQGSWDYRQTALFVNNNQLLREIMASFITLFIMGQGIKVGILQTFVGTYSYQMQDICNSTLHLLDQQEVYRLSPLYLMLMRQEI